MSALIFALRFGWKSTCRLHSMHCYPLNYIVSDANCCWLNEVLGILTAVFGACLLVFNDAVCISG